MTTARQAARQRRRRHRQMLGTTLALAIAGVVVCLVVASLPGRKADAGPVAATPVTTAPVRATAATTSDRPASTASPTVTGTPTPTPTASASATAAHPSATHTPRPPRQTSAASSAGRIRPGTTYRGVATAYEAGNGDGACLFGPSPDLMIAAMNTTDYETARACGAYVLVRAANGASVTVRITNECPAPCAPGQLDLSQQAFAKLGDLKLGRIPITWSLLSPSTSGTISIRYKTGSSPYWCGIQAIGHRNPVAGLEVRTAAGWRRLPRTDYNYFISADGSGCGGAIRITDIYGQQLTVSGIALRPNVVQPTHLQFAQH
ncbi:expansin EXLX1 family cellulose-binding protein [Streptomyces yaanensis]|uniref:Expansin EXLX1 family cellulose-binding protein n=1 Tax=Streptomyces yaanensis TaxID=1142239 RepID=A0ABV7SA66_9ACTN|nr:expansin EXLX1 family cellulose-binding protein [Streptomyces sp. CGMCC 4.7035]WNC00197.1 expansin EXLX1 family cellulose-binding protein [Streptomyces sp. CGMCC 4.7035]